MIAAMIRRSLSSSLGISSTMRATRHHHDSVAQPGQLDRVARLDDHRGALVGLVAQRLVDVEPGADVDTLGGLVGQDDVELPRRNGRISATFCWLPPDRYCAGCSIDAAFNRNRGTRLVTGLRSRRRLTKPKRPKRLRTCSVALARTPRAVKIDSALRSALSRTMPARSGPGGLEMLTVFLRKDRAVRGLDAGQGTQELHLAVALGSGDADDLAAAHGEVDRTEPPTAAVE